MTYAAFRDVLVCDTSTLHCLERGDQSITHPSRASANEEALEVHDFGYFCNLSKMRIPPAKANLILVKGL